VVNAIDSHSQYAKAFAFGADGFSTGTAMLVELLQQPALLLALM
jgi:glutamate synthase domain-containing protein 2